MCFVFFSLFRLFCWLFLKRKEKGTTFEREKKKGQEARKKRTKKQKKRKNTKTNTNNFGSSTTSREVPRFVFFFRLSFFFHNPGGYPVSVLLFFFNLSLPFRFSSRTTSGELPRFGSFFLAQP